jgi:predicted phage-related endonuclease
MPRLSDAELAERHLGLGATDVVEACGLAPWADAGPMHLYALKTGQAAESEDDPHRLETLEWGVTQEEVLADWYERTMGVSLLLGGHVPHREIPWLWATLDRKAPDRIIECKHVGPAMAHHWSESEEDGIPQYVRAQCLVGQACLGTRLTDVVASVGGRPPHVWTVAWDEEAARLLIEEAGRFWELVRSRTPPPHDATPWTAEMLRRKYPGGGDRAMIPATFEMETIAADRMAAMVEERDAIVKKKLADYAMLEKIGAYECDGVRGEGWSMSWRADKHGVRRQRFTARGLV